MADSDGVVSVEICGQRYPIRSTLDAEYVGRLAGYVDEKIRAAGESASSGDGQRLAVLAALNIADECFRLRASAESASSGAETRAREMLRTLAEAVGE